MYMHERQIRSHVHEISALLDPSARLSKLRGSRLVHLAL